MLDSDQLHAFRVFAEHLNFTHAARALALSQPALHAKIGRLSEAVGSPLYLRQGRSLELTEAGRTVLTHARECWERDQALLERLHGGQRGRPVTLAAGEGSLLYLLGPVLGAWSGAPLRVLRRSAPEAIAAVREGLAHLGLSAGLRAPSDLESTVLRASGQVLVVREDHPLAKRDHLVLTDLEEVPLVLPPPGSRHRDAVEGALAAAGVTAEVRVESGGWAVMLHLAALGLGAALVNDICPPPPGCVALPVRGLPGVRYFLLWRPSERDEQARALLAELQGLATVERPS